MIKMCCYYFIAYVSLLFVIAIFIISCIPTVFLYVNRFLWDIPRANIARRFLEPIECYLAISLKKYAHEV